MKIRFIRSKSVRKSTRNLKQHVVSSDMYRKRPGRSIVCSCLSKIIVPSPFPVRIRAERSSLAFVSAAYMLSLDASHFGSSTNRNRILWYDGDGLVKHSQPQLRVASFFLICNFLLEYKYWKFRGGGQLCSTKTRRILSLIYICRHTYFYTLIHMFYICKSSKC